MSSSERGQGESLGTVLTIAVVVFLVAIPGTVFLQEFSQSARQQESLADIDVTVSSTNVTVVNTAGDAIDTTSLRVLLRANGSTTSHDIDVGDGEFAPGDRWTTAHGLSAGTDVEVLVVERDTESVLARRVATVPAD